MPSFNAPTLKQCEMKPGFTAGLTNTVTPQQGWVSHLGQLVFSQDCPSLLVFGLQDENRTVEPALENRGTKPQTGRGKCSLRTYEPGSQTRELPETSGHPELKQTQLRRCWGPHLEPDTATATNHKGPESLTREHRSLAAHLSRHRQSLTPYERA